MSTCMPVTGVQGLTEVQYSRAKQHRNRLQKMRKVKSWPRSTRPVEITASNAVNIDFAKPVFTFEASQRSYKAIHF